jgi:hypothetical protein
MVSTLEQPAVVDVERSIATVLAIAAIVRNTRSITSKSRQLFVDMNSGIRIEDVEYTATMRGEQVLVVKREKIYNPSDEQVVTEILIDANEVRSQLAHAN